MAPIQIFFLKLKLALLERTKFHQGKQVEGRKLNVSRLEGMGQTLLLQIDHISNNVNLPSFQFIQNLDIFPENMVNLIDCT